MRPHLGRAGAAALIGLAILALFQAATAARPAPVYARPVSQVAVQHAGGDVLERGRRTVADGHLDSRPAAPPAAVPVIPPGRAAVRVPILMYHYIRVVTDPRDQLGFNLSVTPADFAHQLDWLQANGYHPIDFNDLRGYFAGRNGLPPRPVILTFDDGYRDLYTTAYPVLRAHRFKAVAYIVSGFLGAPSNVTPEMVQEMDANGIQIASHTVSHVDLTKTPQPELNRQLVESKQVLESLIGHPVVDFCYPSGQVNSRVADAVAGAGYQTATTTAPGALHAMADRLLWSRVRVSGGEGLDRYAAELSGEEPTVLASGVPMPDLAPHRAAPKLIFPLALSPGALPTARFEAYLQP